MYNSPVPEPAEGNMKELSPPLSALLGLWPKGAEKNRAALFYPSTSSGTAIFYYFI